MMSMSMCQCVNDRIYTMLRPRFSGKQWYILPLVKIIDVKKVFFTFLTFFIFHTFGKIKKSENLRPAQAMVSFHFFHAERF